MAVGVLTSDLSVDSDSPSSERAVRLTEYIRSPGVFVFRMGEADFFRDETLLIDGGMSSGISVVPSWRARERVVARDEGVGGGGMAGGPREAERVLPRPMGSGFSGSSFDLCFFGGMVGVEVSCWSGSMEWATRWAEHFAVDLVKTAVRNCQVAKWGKKEIRYPEENGRNKIYSICAFRCQSSRRVSHHLELSLARLSKCFEVMLENFFVYLQSLYATDRLFQPPSFK